MRFFKFLMGLSVPLVTVVPGIGTPMVAAAPLPSVAERVMRIIADTLGVDPSEVTLEMNLIEDLGAESLDIVKLRIAFERNFHLSISDQDMKKIQTVGDAVSYFDSRSEG